MIGNFIVPRINVGTFRDVFLHGCQVAPKSCTAQHYRGFYLMGEAPEWILYKNKV